MTACSLYGQANLTLENGRSGFWMVVTFGEEEGGRHSGSGTLMVYHSACIPSLVRPDDVENKAISNCIAKPFPFPSICFAFCVLKIQKIKKMKISNFERCLEAQIDYDLGFRVRVRCVSPILYIFTKKKKKIINGLYAIYRPLIMHGLIRA